MSGNEGGQQQGEEKPGDGQQQQGGDGKQEEQKFQPVTYKSQEELDAAFSDRATRAAESAKKEALKSFEDAGATPDQALEAWKAWKAEEDKKKSPEALEREKRETAERELQTYKNKEARDKLSKEVSQNLKVGDHPLPAELLAGSTKEEMEAHGKSIIAFIEQLAGKSGPRSPEYNSAQGYSQQDKVNSGDPLRNLFMTGSFQ